MLKKQINDRYGGSQGFVKTYNHRAMYYLGKYDLYKGVDWEQVKRLVFVCKGNICRSAFAEVVAKNLNIKVISCGIDTHDGLPAYEKAIHAAAKRGYSLDKHRTRKITSIDFKEGDQFIVMEPYQARFVEKLLKQHTAITLLGLWGLPVKPYLHDPYGSDEGYFDYCFRYIEEVVGKIGARLG